MRFFAYPTVAATTPIGHMISFAGGDSVDGIAFSPSGMYVAIGGAFSGRSSASTTRRRTRRSSGRRRRATSTALVFAPNGNAIIAGTDDCGHVLVCN